MIAHAADSKQADAACWILLDRAAKMAAGAGSVPAALRAIDLKASRFEFDARQAQADAVTQTFKAKVSAEQRRANAEAILALLDKLAAAEVPEAALVCAAEFREAAHAAAENALARQLDARVKEFQIRKEEFDQAEEARQQLKTQPDDAEANRILGKYLCFRKNDWPAGLPLLLRGDDEALQRLAKQESLSPADAAARLQLADAWYDFAKHDTSKTAAAAAQRARYWYEASLNDLSGLEQVKAEKRIDELAHADEPRPHDEPPREAAPAKTVEPPAARCAAVYASALNSFEIYLNGVKLGAGNTAAVARFNCELKPGDVLTVRAEGAASPVNHAFACAIIFDTISGKASSSNAGAAACRRWSRIRARPAGRVTRRPTPPRGTSRRTFRVPRRRWWPRSHCGRFPAASLAVRRSRRPPACRRPTCSASRSGAASWAAPRI